jgi:uncharacterized protein YceH (UPF0502 family)
MLVPAARPAECVCDSGGVLTHAEARVLGSLIEKQLTTPDVYPLTLKALTAACNQSSNRDPVMALTADEVETTVLVLKTKGLARVIHPGSGERSTRYRQVAEEALRLDDAERAVIGALLLRGAQTEAELRTRTERLHPFAGNELVDTLARLASRPEPLAVRLERQAGQRETRWIQLLEDDPYVPEAASVATRALDPSRPDRLAELEARVVALEAQVARLLDALGEPS